LDQAPFDAPRDVASGASGADGSAAAPEKLKLLEDELSKLRAEINAMMMSSTAADDSASMLPPPPPLLSAMPPPSNKSAAPAQFQLPPPPPPIAVAATTDTAPIDSGSDAPIDDSCAPAPPQLPSAVAAALASASKKRSRRATIAMMSPPAQVKSVKVKLAVRPSEDDVQAGRAGLRRTEVRRSLGGTPWRTPPKERAKRALDAEDDPDAPVDQQTMIARALRKKFASIRVPSPQKRGGVVLGANHRPCLADVTHNNNNSNNTNQNSLAM
jgi:hypothetical protein